MVTFKVSGLKNTTPSKPKVTSAKRNAKVVKGSAQKYMKVTIKIGSKSYTVSADRVNGLLSFQRSLRRALLLRYMQRTLLIRRVRHVHTKLNNR